MDDAENLIPRIGFSRYIANIFGIPGTKKVLAADSRELLYRVNYGTEETPLNIDWTETEYERLCYIKDFREGRPPDYPMPKFNCWWPDCRRKAVNERGLCQQHYAKALKLGLYERRKRLRGHSRPYNYRPVQDY